jgi:competence protein ComEC
VLALALAVAGVVAIACRPDLLPDARTPVRPDRRPIPGGAAVYTIDAFDVGTGLSILVRGPDFALLYDGGSNDDRAQGRKNRLLAYLEETVGPSGDASCRPNAEPDAAPAPERTIEHLVLSHPHRDHVSLLPDVLRCYAVRHVWDSGMAFDSAIYAAFGRAARDEPGVRLHQPPLDGSTQWPGAAPIREGDRVELGRDAAFTVLSAQSDARDPNDASLVLRVDLGARSLLLPGDATAGERNDPSDAPSPRSVEGRLLAERPAELDVDVLVVGHHGSLTSSRSRFLEAVSPRWAIVSSGPFAYSKVVLPDAAVLSAIERTGARLLRTDHDDAACAKRSDKAGLDADDQPGGCDAVRLAIDATGAVRIERGR